MIEQSLLPAGAWTENVQVLMYPHSEQWLGQESSGFPGDIPPGREAPQPGIAPWQQPVHMNMC